MQYGILKTLGQQTQLDWLDVIIAIISVLTFVVFGVCLFLLRGESRKKHGEEQNHRDDRQT